MKTFKRILAILAIIFSIAGILLSVGGIVGVLQVRSALLARADGLAARLENLLANVDQVLYNATTLVGGGHDLVDEIDQAALQASDIITQNSPVMDALQARLDEKLRPRLDNLAQIYRTLKETIASANDVIAAANSLPFISLPSISTEGLQAIDASIAEAQAAVQELQADLAAIKQGTVQGTTEAILESTGKVDQKLEEVGVRLEDYQVRVSASRQSLAAGRIHQPSSISPLMPGRIISGTSRYCLNT